jgi:hypothetical protein
MSLEIPGKMRALVEDQSVSILPALSVLHNFSRVMPYRTDDDMSRKSLRVRLPLFRRSLSPSWRRTISWSRSLTSPRTLPVRAVLSSNREVSVVLTIFHTAFFGGSDVDLVDWKHASIPGLSVPGAIIGCDFSGTVVTIPSICPNPNKLQVGDKIAGMVHGGKFPTKGSFAQYLRVPSDTCWKVPESVGLRDAPVYGVGFITAAGVLYRRQKHEYPPAKIEGDHWYLVYGGSTAVGMFAVQVSRVACPILHKFLVCKKLIMLDPVLRSWPSWLDTRSSLPPVPRTLTWSSLTGPTRSLT